METVAALRDAPVVAATVAASAGSEIAKAPCALVCPGSAVHASNLNVQVHVYCSPAPSAAEVKAKARIPEESITAESAAYKAELSLANGAVGLARVNPTAKE